MADQDGVAVVEEIAVAAEPTADGPQGVKREREEEDVGATESKRAAAGDEAPQVSRSPLQGPPPPPCLPPKTNASVTSQPWTQVRWRPLQKLTVATTSSSHSHCNLKQAQP